MAGQSARERTFITLLGPAPTSSRCALSAGTVQLLTLVASSRNQAASRVSITQQLWADIDWNVARRRLNTAVHRAKNELVDGGAGDCLRSTARNISLCLSGDVSIDLIEFERAFERSIDARPLCEEDFDALAAACDLHEHFVVPDGGDWTLAFRGRLDGHAIALHTRLAEEALTHRRIDLALVHAEAALALDPFREDLHRVAIRCQLARGDRAGALARFENLKLLLARELDASPMPETIRLIISGPPSGPASAPPEQEAVDELRRTLDDVKRQLEHSLEALSHALASISAR